MRWGVIPAAWRSAISKRTLPSVAPISQVLSPQGVPETVIVVLGACPGIAMATISVARRSRLTKMTPGCLRIWPIEHLLWRGVKAGGGRDHDVSGLGGVLAGVGRKSSPSPAHRSGGPAPLAVCIGCERRDQEVQGEGHEKPAGAEESGGPLRFA